MIESIPYLKQNPENIPWLAVLSPALSPCSPPPPPRAQSIDRFHKKKKKKLIQLKRSNGRSQENEML